MRRPGRVGGLPWRCTGGQEECCRCYECEERLSAALYHRRFSCECGGTLRGSRGDRTLHVLPLESPAARGTSVPARAKIIPTADAEAQAAAVPARADEQASGPREQDDGKTLRGRSTF